MPGGKFINGKLQGNGHISFANGDRYQGNFKDGYRCGFGTMEYKNLPLYERVRHGGHDDIQLERDIKDHGTYNG